MAKKNVIKKLAGKERMEADHETAKSIVEMEVSQERLKMNEQRQREVMIGQCFKAIGQVQTSNMFAKFATVSSLVWLRQVKGSKVYKDIPGVGTWEKFCDSVGMSRQKVDEDLANLGTLGETFLLTCQQLSVGYRDLRKLRQIAHNGEIIIDAECVTIGEDQIPLSSDHAEDLQVAIESLLETKDNEIEDKNAAIRANEKVLQAKEKVIQKQEKELARFEGRAAELGYTAGEEALIQKMDNARTTIDGFLMQFDPEIHPLPEDCTMRMQAKLMHTLDYFKRVIIATFDTASDLYGEPEMDDDWVPPHLRQKAEDRGQSSEGGDPANTEA